MMDTGESSSDDEDNFQHMWDPRNLKEYSRTIQTVNEDNDN
jgi:hypothetical protein